MKSALLILIAVSLNACSTNTKVAPQSSLTPAQQADQEAWQDASQRALEDVHQAGNTAIRFQNPDRN
jgi:PBP1b-binding outer membrane lipoprotein LpoB